ncbi:MAG: PRC-barrel domain-containing protein [Rhodobacter sp.]|nr:PRC-barrel domain-containing protein [Rhodobacter sp.]
MKTLLANTVAASALALVAFPALADSHEAERQTYLPGIEQGVRASDFIGKTVYVTEADTTGMSTEAIAEADAAWQNAGEINDLMISLSGDTEAVLVDVGGFLGIGEKTVAVALNELTLVPDTNSPDDYFIVFHGTSASLEAAPAFDPEMVFEAAEPTADPAADPALTKAEPPIADPATQEAVTSVTEPQADPLPGETVDLSTWVEDDLIGMRVYGPNDEDVGEISAVAVGTDGKIEGAVVDVGGFLGIGEKKVALDSGMLMLVREADGDSWFRVGATQEQLESMEPQMG